jgi:hypothetical protein
MKLPLRISLDIRPFMIIPEATSLDWKISVFGKSQRSAIQPADEKPIGYTVHEFETLEKQCWSNQRNIYDSNELFFYKHFAHNLPIFLQGNIWLNIGICQTLVFTF